MYCIEMWHFGDDVNQCSTKAEPLMQDQNYEKHVELITQCLWETSHLDAISLNRHGPPHTHTHTQIRRWWIISLLIDLFMRLTVDKAFPCNWTPVNGSFPSCSCVSLQSQQLQMSCLSSCPRHSSDTSSFRHACLVCNQFYCPPEISSISQFSVWSHWEIFCFSNVSPEKKEH